MVVLDITPKQEVTKELVFQLARCGEICRWTAGILSMVLLDITCKQEVRKSWCFVLLVVGVGGWTAGLLSLALLGITPKKEPQAPRHPDEALLLPPCLFLVQAALKAKNAEMARGVRISAGLRSVLSVVATLLRSTGEQGPTGGHLALPPLDVQRGCQLLLFLLFLWLCCLTCLGCAAMVIFELT